MCDERANEFEQKVVDDEVRIDPGLAREGIVNAVVLDASAATEIVVRTTLGRCLLALVPRDRSWWVPDHFHVEAAGAIRRVFLNGLIDATRACGSLAAGRAAGPSHVELLPAASGRCRPFVSSSTTGRSTWSWLTAGAGVAHGAAASRRAQSSSSNDESESACSPARSPRRTTTSPVERLR